MNGQKKLRRLWIRIGTSLPVFASSGMDCASFVLVDFMIKGSESVFICGQNVVPLGALIQLLRFIDGYSMVY